MSSETRLKAGAADLIEDEARTVTEDTTEDGAEIAPLAELATASGETADMARWADEDTASEACETTEDAASTALLAEELTEAERDSAASETDSDAEAAASEAESLREEIEDDTRAAELETVGLADEAVSSRTLASSLAMNDAVAVK